MPPSEPLVPEQTTGLQENISETVELESVAAAASLFQVAKQRLLDMNTWHLLCAGPSAVFTQHDAQGQRITTRPAEVGDRIQIDLPGPGTKAGDGYDWTQVEAIETQDGPDHESIALRVRPTTNPRDQTAVTAHFLDPQATSTFVVQRTGTSVTAAMHGRNELPNTSGGLLDTVRNTLTTAGGLAGLAQLQWKELVTGLLRQEKYEN